MLTLHVTKESINIVISFSVKSVAFTIIWLKPNYDKFSVFQEWTANWPENANTFCVSDSAQITSDCFFPLLSHHQVNSIGRIYL